MYNIIDVLTLKFKRQLDNSFFVIGRWTGRGGGQKNLENLRINLSFVLIIFCINFYDGFVSCPISLIWLVYNK